MAARVINISSDDEACDIFHLPLFMAIGTFDGVHLGHQKLINTTIDLSQKYHGISCVYTFDPYPTFIVSPESPKTMIYSIKEKLNKLKQLSVDAVIVQKFDKIFYEKSPEEFISFLRKKFPTLTHICVGENFTFGHNKRGNVNTLEHLARGINIGVTIVPLLEINGRKISSSAIRRFIAAKQFDQANLMLGDNYF